MSLTEEQINVIKSIQDVNICVNAVAGSGKTSTIIEIVKKYTDVSILIITYNSALRHETKFKLKKYSNAEVHTYHSFFCKYYDNTAKTDYDIQYMKRVPLHTKEFNILILDEVQDIKEIYVEIIKENILKDFKISRVALFGDIKQNIYSDLGSNDIYLKKPKNIISTEWKHCKLSKTFRCPVEVTNLVNNLMGYNYIDTYDKNNIGICNLVLVNNPRYYDPYTKSFNVQSEMLEDKYKRYGHLEYWYIAYMLKSLIDEKIKYKDILLIFPYASCNKSLKELLNYIPQLNNNNIIYLNFLVNINQDARNYSFLQNKLLVSTIHSTKGLEKDVIFFVGFDNSFNDIMFQDELTCSNLLYVALTRAKKRLYLFTEDNKRSLFYNTYQNYTNVIHMNNPNLELKHIYNDMASYIIEKKHYFNSYTSLYYQFGFDKFINYERFSRDFIEGRDKKKVTSVTEFINFKALTFYTFFRDKFYIKCLTNTSLYVTKSYTDKSIEKDTVIKEDISSIMGHIIVFYYMFMQDMYNNSITIVFNSICSLLKLDILSKFRENIVLKESNENIFRCLRKDAQGISLFVKYFVEFINFFSYDTQMEHKCIKPFFRMCLNYMYVTDITYKYKKSQINVNTIKETDIMTCSRRIKNCIDIICNNELKDYTFEYEHKLLNNNFSGKIDLLIKHKVDNLHILCEFKCTTLIQIQHYIQLIIYCILYMEANKCELKNIKLYMIYVLYNRIEEVDISKKYEEIRKHLYVNTETKSYRRLYNLIDEYRKRSSLYYNMQL